jgi:2-haloalkanoic acid dehalogenase type II
MPIKSVTLDLDDTLWDCAPVIMGAEDCFHEWLDENYPQIGEHYDRDALVNHRHESYRLHPDMLHDFTYLRKKWLERLGYEFGYADELVETGFGVFWRARNAVELYQCVPEVLADLHARYHVAALTNGNADVHHIGIGHWFHFVATAADAGSLKPAPDMFQLALESAGVSPHEAVHVGDDPVNDVQGAAAVGMKTVWVNAPGAQWSHAGAQPDAEVKTVAELAEVLRRL